MRFLPLLALLLAAPALAQDPAPPLVDLGALALDAVPLTDSGELQVTANGAPMGTVATTSTLDSGVLTVVQRFDVPQAGPPRTDSTRMAWPALTPLSDAFEAGPSPGTVAYGEGTISGTYARNGAPLPFEFETEGPRYPAAALPFIVQALPFEPGLAVTVPVFSPKERFRDATLTVGAPEDVEMPDGSVVEAWTVRQVGGGGMNGMFPQTHYVDAETRALLKTTFEVQGMAIEIAPQSEAAAAEAEAEAAAAEAARATAPRLGPGAEALAVDRLDDHELALTVRLVEPMQQDAGTETRTLAVDREAGTVTLTTETSIPMAGQQMTATYVAAYPSLAAVSLAQDDGSDTTELAFADGTVTGTDEGEAVDDTLESDVFINGFLPVLVTLLPFEEGYTALVPGYSSGDGIVEITLSVTGMEEADGRDVWVVDADRDDDTPTLTFRVDAETFRLVSYGLAPQPGVRVEFQSD